MAGTRRLEIVIAGDAKGALGAFAQTEAGAGGLGAKLGKLGPIAAAAGLAVAAGVAGVGVALFKIGESFDEQYDKIRVATGATGKALEDLKGDFKAVVSEVPASFEDAGTAISKFSQNLGDSGKNVQVLSEQMLELSRITKTDLAGNVDASVAVIKNWNLEGEDMTNVMDLIFRASQISGIAFSDLSTKLAENGVVFRGLGFNVEQATTVIAGLGKAGVDVADVMPALTKTLTAAAKAGKSATVVYQETLKAIKDAPDAWTASAKAIEVFGAKAGPKFAELIREGKFAFDDLGESIAEGTETIIQAGKDTQDFGEKWTLLKNRVMVALEPLAMKVFDGVGQAMDRLGPVVTNVATAFGEGGLGGALRVLKGYFDNLDGSTKAIIISIAAVGLAIWAATAPVTLIIAALAALAIGLVYAYQNFDTFAAVVDTAAQAVMTEIAGIQIVVGALLLVWEDAWPRMQRATELAVLAVRDVSAGVSEFLNVVGPAVDAFRAGWELNWQLMAGSLGDAYRSTIGPILAAISGAIQQVLDLIDRLPHGNASGGLSIPIPGGGSLGIPNPFARAAGGPVLANTAYMVGERGPELFVPGRSGTVIPNGAGGGGTVINIHVTAGVGDKVAIGREVAGVMESFFATGGMAGRKTKAALRS